MGSVTVKRSGKNTINDIIKNMQQGSVKVGWFPSARYDDEHNTPVASVAAQNEYGNPNKHIPARPFIRPAIAQFSNDWKDIGKRGLKAVLAGKSTTTQVLEKLGGRMVGDIQKSIDQVYTPTLSQRTIQNRIDRSTHKGRFTRLQARSATKPLIDTGHMQATVSYEIGND